MRHPPYLAVASKLAKKVCYNSKSFIPTKESTNKSQKWSQKGSKSILLGSYDITGSVKIGISKAVISEIHVPSPAVLRELFAAQPSTSRNCRCPLARSTPPHMRTQPWQSMTVYSVKVVSCYRSSLGLTLSGQLITPSAIMSYRTHSA